MIGKKHKAAVAKVDKPTYLLSDALKKAKEVGYAGFDESVDLAIRLGVDPQRSDQMVRGFTALPHGTGKKIRILVFTKGEKEREAKEAGADVVGLDDLVEKINKGWCEFDTAIATPDVMATVGKLGKVLGPRGLMPNPKTGTVTFDVAKTVRELRQGRIEYRTDKTGIVHGSIGRRSFSAENLLDNAQAFLDAIIKARPATAKGQYVKGITVSSTMGPGVPVDITRIDGK